MKILRDILFLSGLVVFLLKVLDKFSRLIEKEFVEVVSKWVVEKLEKLDESNLFEIFEYEVGFIVLLFID